MQRSTSIDSLPPRDRGTTVRKGFTIIELLVVTAVIGVLLALLLPAVQSSREAARKTICRNRLKQLSLAVANFESTYGYLPSNGWGYQWIGDPDRGVGPKQPGGWIYQLLPFFEQVNLADLGAGEDDLAKQQSLGKLIQIPLPLVRCPTRPAAPQTVVNPFIAWHNAEVAPFVAKTDYAINEGDWITDTDDGPDTIAEGDDPLYPWPDLSRATGVSFQRSQVRYRDILDGASNTYLIGEKFVSLSAYTDDSDWGYDASLYCGVDIDIARWTIEPPLRDSIDGTQYRRFGSAHDDTSQMAMCDGSVKSIAYNIDADLHRHLGHRKDGEITDLP